MSLKPDNSTSMTAAAEVGDTVLDLALGAAAVTSQSVTPELSTRKPKSPVET